MELQQRASTREALTVYRTIVVVDMVGYSDLARVLEENTCAIAVAELNGQIQNLIRSGLSPLPDGAEYCTVAETGDGIILAFQSAANAHYFAEHLHLNAAEHNRSRTHESATRWFRVGIASGEVTRMNLRHEDCGWAGITIANAVRLEGSAQRGEIVMDLASFEALPEELRRAYGDEATVRGKRAESFRVRKYRVIGELPETADAGKSEAAAVASSAPQPVRLSRRGAVAFGAAAAGAVALGIWMERGEMERMLDPLPQKRYVALHAWPKPAAEVASIVNRMVASIEDRLARAEPRDKQFMVMYPGDPLYMASGLPIPGDGLAEVADALGANLVLAASVKKVGNRLSVMLRLMNPASAKVLRHGEILTRLSEVSGLGRTAAEAAARLLELPEANKLMADEEETGEMSTGAYQLLLEGSRLVEEPNESGLDAGVEKLQQLVNEYPRFAIGYAELANGYLRKYRATRQKGMLDLAQPNIEKAMRLNPDSARAMLASAKLAVYMGQTDAAFEQIRKGLKLDPMNSEMLLFKAATFHYLARPTEEEGVYREIIANRPNDWVAYNELGRVLRDRANYTEAVKALSRATQIAPKVSMPLANLGVAYALSGQDEQARVSFERSIALYPQVIAYIGLGDLAFKAGDYRGALARFDKAHDLDPKRDDVLRDLGDCYFMLGQMGKMRECFQQALASLSELLATAPKNPPGWMVHSLYEAKLGHFAEAENDIRTAEAQGGRDLYARFTKSQTLAVMGQKEESLGLLLGCLREGLPIQEVALAVDLSGARADPRYQEFVARRSQPGVSPS